MPVSHSPCRGVAHGLRGHHSWPAAPQHPSSGTRRVALRPQLHPSKADFMWFYEGTQQPPVPIRRFACADTRRAAFSTLPLGFYDLLFWNFCMTQAYDA
jgi:hypothetical protein